MSRLTPALFGMALLTAGNAALAAEPLTLSDHELDTITAGAEAGAIIQALAASGGGSASATSLGTISTPLFALAGVTSPDGTAEAQIEGEVTVTDSGLFKTALGLFVGQTATTGDGQAQVGAGGLTQGGTEVINKTSTFTLGNEIYFVTMAAVLN